MSNQINCDRLDSIAKIQTVKSLYADSGIDINPRIQDWLKRAKLPQKFNDIDSDALESLAKILQRSYEKERDGLKMLSIPAQRFVYSLGFSIAEWIELIQGLNEVDRADWLSKAPVDCRSELSF